MASSKNQRRKKRRRISPLYLVVTTFFLVLVVSWSVQLNKTERDLDTRILDLTQQKNELMAQNDAFRREIELLNTPEYIEQLARDQLGLVRKGEIIVAPKKEN